MTQLKFIFRKLWRDRFFTFLKVLGLAIGIATCLVVFKIVYYEFSFDQQIPDKENIYQVVTVDVDGDKESGFGGVQSVLADYVMEQFPEIEEIVPLNNHYFPFVSIEKENGEIFRKEDPKGYFTNSSYFNLIPYEWLAGNKNTALTQPNQVVLTESKAKEYFGNKAFSEITGKTIQYGEELYTLTGVVKNLGFPSSFQADEFISMPKPEPFESWQWMSFNSNNTLFVKLHPTQKEDFLRRLDQKFEEISKPFDLETEKYFRLLPIAEKHFAQEYNSFVYSANKKIVFGLIGVGVFILLLAGINYINLSTAQIPYRTKEIGVRKTLGEKAGSLTRAFLYETLVICLLALSFSFPLLWGFEKGFHDFLPPGIEDFSNPVSILVFVFILLASLTLLTGLYPAYLIRKVNVSEVLKIQGAGKLSLGNLNIRKALIVFQFVIAQVFVIGAFIIASQIKYMINSDLGFDKDAIIGLSFPMKSYQNAEVDPFMFKEVLKKYPEIQKVALGHAPMNNMIWGNTLYRNTEEGEVQLNMNFKYMDVDYFDLYNIEILAGRAPEARDTVGNVYINEAARVRMGFKTNEEAIDKPVKQYGRKTTVIAGVINDFHQANLHRSKSPLSLVVSNQKNMLMRYNIKLPVSPSEWEKTLGIIEKEWKNYYPQAAFNYEFYDAEIKNLYEEDLRQSKIINLATIITIILGCLGLIGLVSLTAYQRTKEIGIRKVLGSSVSDVVVLLSKDYLKLIGLAILISIPIAWWAMHKWLEDFAFRIEIKWWMFLLTGVITIFIALSAVSFRAIKAALANPVDSLRDE